jgi:YVTN family beta-propeller protein
MKSARNALAAALAWSAAFGCMAAESSPDERTDAARRYVKDGIVVEFEARPTGGSRALFEDELAELRFSIREAASGRPVRGLAPGAWLDVAENLRNKEGAEQKSCKEKIALYLRGIVGIRPMVDLNSYYVVVLNRDASLSIIDPKVSMVGRTSTLARVPLARAGADLARSSDERRIFVSMPAAGQVAVVEADSFKVIANVPAGPGATRLAVQPDGRYLWVGNNAPAGEKGSVTVIDAEALRPVATIPVGRGHHEIALSSDSRWAFVTSRTDGSVTVIDVRTLKPVREIALGGQPISLAYSALSQLLYVAEAQVGVVHAIRPDDLSTQARIQLAPGLGPMRFTPDGRWALVLNTADDKVYVIDPSSNRVVHEIAVQGQPYQIAFTRAFAYVRSLGSERVSMINLATLGAGKTPTVQTFAAGSLPPKAAGELVIADTVVAAPGEAGVLVVNPADNTTYFYMEGMNAAASNYQTYGASARAVTVVDRSLREVEPGVYVSRAKMPAAGRFDVAFSLDSPRMLHCFSTDVAANPRRLAARKGIGVDYLVASREVIAGTPAAVRFRLYDGSSGTPHGGLKDVRVMSMPATGRARTEVAAIEIDDGVYEAQIAVPEAGAYYVFVASDTLNKGFRDLPYLTLMSRAPRAGTAMAR